MSFYLSKTVLYRTTQTPESIAYRLNAELKSAQAFSFWGSSKRFEGMANQHFFSIHRVPYRQSICLAEADGSIRQEKGYTFVEVQFDLPIILKLPIFIGLGLTIACFLMSFLLPSDDKMVIVFRYIPLTMFMIFSLILWIGCKWQTYLLKNDLEDMLRGEIIR